MKLWLAVFVCMYCQFLSFQHECQVYSDEGQDLSNCSIIIFINVHHFNLTQRLNISHSYEFTMTGSENCTTVQCSENSGIILTAIVNVLITHIIFHHCGMLHYLNNVTYSAALLMGNCSNISIHKIRLEESYGTGLVLLNCIGYIHMSRSVFHSGKVMELGDNKKANGGGGVNIQYFNIEETNGTFVNILIENCIISNNNATTYQQPNTCESSNIFGYGGGLAISLNISSSINITVRNTNLHHNDRKV